MQKRDPDPGFGDWKDVDEAIENLKANAGAACRPRLFAIVFDMGGDNPGDPVELHVASTFPAELDDLRDKAIELAKKQIEEER